MGFDSIWNMEKPSICSHVRDQNRFFLLLFIFGSLQGSQHPLPLRSLQSAFPQSRVRCPLRHLPRPVPLQLARRLIERVVRPLRSGYGEYSRPRSVYVCKVHYARSPLCAHGHRKGDGMLGLGLSGFDPVTVSGCAGEMALASKVTSVRIRQ